MHLHVEKIRFSLKIPQLPISWSSLKALSFAEIDKHQENFRQTLSWVFTVMPGYRALQPTKETIHCGELLPRRKTCRFVHEL
jgi:hypothetical protein